MTSALITELSQASGVSEEQASKVLAALGFEQKTIEKLGISGNGFDSLKLADLRISAKIGSVVVAR